jgi:hypothetical protein
LNKITRIDPSRYLFDIHRDLSVSARASKPGPPERIDGMTIGIVTMSHDAHIGERFIRMVTKSYTSYLEGFG